QYVPGRIVQPSLTSAPCCASTREARGAIRIGHMTSKIDTLSTDTPRNASIPSRKALAVSMLRALRPKQWTKNAVVFAALVFDHLLFDASRVMTVLGAFVVFCLVSSAVYLVNDILDVESDRLHPKKRLRPIAAGHV